MTNQNNSFPSSSQNTATKKDQAKLAWGKLAKWIQAKELKVILILEGEPNKSTKKLVKNIQKWTAEKQMVQCIKMEHAISKNEKSYFEPIISQLPKAGQITIFENCWFEKSIEKNQLGKWNADLWNNFREKENMLEQAGFLILKYAFKNQKEDDNSEHPIFPILTKTENPNNPFFYFKCWEKKTEAFTLMHHLIRQIPHHDLTFPNHAVNFEILKKRAFNLRWATMDADVIPLTAADPDFPIAPEIQEAMNNYIAGGYFSYGPAEGLPELRNAASEVLKNRKGMDCPPECILPTDGAASAMYTIANFALQPGDEAIIFDPVDFLFQKSVESAGGKIIRIPMDTKTGSFNPKTFKNAISKKTKMICLCNPHNPMGRVLTQQELLFIGSLAVKHKLWIMNDEIWSDIIFAPNQHINIASLHPEIAERTISVYGFSKTFGLAGLRVGFIAAPSLNIFNKIIKTSKATTTAGGVSTLSQVAATAAYEHAWYWADAFLEHLTKVRDYAVKRLNNMPGIKCRKPEGTYLLFPNIENFGKSSTEVAEYLLENAKVAVVPGAAKWFGPGAEGHIRICFSTSMEVMEEALNRIEKALKQLYRETKLTDQQIYFKNFDPEKVSFQ